MSKSIRESLFRVRFLVLAALLCAISLGMVVHSVFTRRVEAVSTTVVISQIYGGGGNAGATLKNDFIELFNKGTSPVNVTGWTVQYTSAAGTFSAGNSTTLSGTIQPGRYYLIQEAAGAGGTVSLPAPDATGGIAMSATNAKVALVNNNAVLAGSGCPFAASVVDFVGYGTGGSAPNCSETIGAPTLTNTTADFRASGGCTDTDSNGADFATGAPAPRNSASAANNCGGSSPSPSPSPSTNPTGVGSANPSAVLPGASSLLTVTVTPGANPTSTGLAVTADLSSIGGSASQSFSGSGNTFTFTATVSNATTPGAKSLPFTITDAQARTGSGSIALTVKTPAPANNVVISQVYGGGGNTGADFTNDFIELINHSSAPVSLNGWSVQAFIGGTWLVTPLTNVTLQPGQYYLIQESQGAGGTDPLPTPDAIGTITVSSTSGKVALVNNSTQLTGTCPDADPGAVGIVDFIGYGSANASDCFEGSTGPAPTLDNLTAAQRRNEGCFDTNDNAADFVTGSPNPRNTATPVHDCTALFGYGSSNPSSVSVGNNVALSVDVAAAQNPASTGITVTADLSSIGGSPSQPFSGSGNIFTFNAIVSNSTTGGFKSLPVTITDAQARTFSTTIVLSVLPAVADHVTISQIYGGGGNAGGGSTPPAVYTNDYVELYNPTSSNVTVTGWSIQYASATGTSWTNKQPIGGTIGPNQYMLVALGSGGSTGAPLPPAQISGGINMSATAGKVALVKNSDNLAGACPLGSDTDIVDFVGYGSTANCHEGTANAPAPANDTAIFRKSKPPQDPNQGAQDTDQNGNDFITGAPNPRQTAPIAELGPWVAGTDPSSGGFNVPHDDTVLVSFSEPVNVDPGWFNINCTVTGSHNSATEAHTNDAMTYAFTPNTNFQFGEQCTVTVFKTAVHDQDLDDSNPDTDTLLDNYTWSFTVVAAGQPAPYAPSVHLTMGDPGCGTAFGCAVASTSQPNNFLMEKPTYATSYNRDKGTPNWVSWHLEPAWYGTLARVDTFRADPQVDPTWYRVQSFDYSGTGFDRGHMTPNADRDNQNRIPINQETYLMSNMVPQAPDNNQGPWAALEGDLRTISDAGNELYIISGPNGVGGTGSNGGTTTTVANGHVTVPSSTWKVALVLPLANGDDTARVTCSTRTIAVIMPNAQGIRNNPWQTYLTTVDAVEQLTGYDFFSNLPPAVQACIEAGTNGTNPPGTANQSASTTEDNSVTVTLQALRSNSNSLTFTIVGGPSSGSLGSVSASTCSGGSCTATVTYTPAADFNGSDSFTFKASDGSTSSNTSTVSIGVSEVNDSPSATDDSKTTAEDTQLVFPSSDLTANDSTGPANESGQVLTVTSVTAGANTHGTVGLTSGTITYTPDANFNGAASFTYSMCDDGTTNGSPDSKCASATVNITVTAVNDNPTAADDSASTDEDTPVTVNVLNNDSDVDNDSLTISAVTQGSHGSVVNNGNNLSYSPAANFNGTDSFTYTISDGHGGTATANVSITINAVNDNPNAVDDAATTNEDTAVTVNVLGNDSDVDADSLTVSAVTQGAHGAVVNNGSNVTYSPAANYNGTDSFTYTISDGHGGTATASVSVTIIAVNDAPVANNDSATTNEDTAVTVNVLTNDSDVDGDSLSVSGVTQGAHGLVTTNGTSVSYSPAADFNGTDSFTYTISDGHGGTATASVSVTINAVNDAPVANADTAATNEDTAVTVNVLTNDSDVDGDTLAVSSVTQGTNGAVTNNGTSVTYTPAANFNGTDSFTYTISDGHGGTATANVSVTINAVNDAPVANADTAATNEDTAVTVNVLTNDSDVDGDTLAVSSVTQGTNGAVTNNGTSVTYTPAANFNGTDSFSYTISDGHGGTATANVSVTVSAVNDNPVAVADSTSTNEDNSVTIDVVANDTDVDGDSLSLASVGSAAHGTVSIVSGKAVYSPNPNYNGTDSFGYVVSDGHGGQANGAVSVTINPVNDAPVADSQSVNTASNTPVAITLTGSDVETSTGSLIFTVTSGPSHGSLSGTGANRIYTPGLNYSGPDSFQFTVTDTGDGSSPALTSSAATVSITVNDTVGPTITLNGNSISLWPPNHSYHTVNVSDLVAGASDNFDPNVNLNSVVIAQVTSDEIENGNGDGNTMNDIVIASDCKSVQLRAERDGDGDGRVYTITFLVRDAAGNTTTATAKVTVPKNNGGTAVDSGPHYIVNSTCH
jgi:DNA/RNA endonuclease G (NUC1)